MAAEAGQPDPASSTAKGNMGGFLKLGVPLKGGCMGYMGFRA